MEPSQGTETAYRLCYPGARQTLCMVWTVKSKTAFFWRSKMGWKMEIDTVENQAPRLGASRLPSKIIRLRSNQNEHAGLSTNGSKTALYQKIGTNIQIGAKKFSACLSTTLGNQIANSWIDRPISTSGSPVLSNANRGPLGRPPCPTDPVCPREKPLGRELPDCGFFTRVANERKSQKERGNTTKTSVTWYLSSKAGRKAFVVVLRLGSVGHWLPAKVVTELSQHKNHSSKVPCPVSQIFILRHSLKNCIFIDHSP